MLNEILIKCKCCTIIIVGVCWESLSWLQSLNCEVVGGREGELPHHWLAASKMSSSTSLPSQGSALNLCEDELQVRNRPTSNPALTGVIWVPCRVMITSDIWPPVHWAGEDWTFIIMSWSCQHKHVNYEPHQKIYPHPFRLRDSWLYICGSRL